MKISYNWLKEYIDFDLSPNELADVLTMLGLEVGGVAQIGGLPNELEGVVVGEVMSVVKHPNADRLRLCKVNVNGPDMLHIVCGAPNVAEGQKVAVATVGTTLYPFESDQRLKIKRQKVRGEESQGMICAEDELGLGPEHDGILVLPETATIGQPAAEVLATDLDYVLEIDLTPNRIDGASHYGVARDLAAYLRSQAKLPDPGLDPAELRTPNPIPVRIEDQTRCLRYSAIYISGVSVTESPAWMQDRLRAIGLRPINNIVDITNYVLHELGQPMHAFDADQLQGGEIIVKTLPEDQVFITLDGVERKLLAGQDLMICDAEAPHCIAGTMGGIHSGVTEQTRNVFLESAYFVPGTVRRTAKRLGLSSDSSFRFERGADPHMTQIAALRAAGLMVSIAGGDASAMSDIKLDEFPPYPVDLSLKKTRSLIGQALSREEVISILEHLEITVQAGKDEDMLHLLVPHYRVDVQREVDVIEDILRIYGYNQIEIPEALNASLDFRQYRNAFRLREHYANILSANGFYEMLNNSLVHIKQGDAQAVEILNPLGEEQGILRQSMLPGALETLRFNQNRQQEYLAFYEFGKSYRRKGQAVIEKDWLVLVVAGQRHPTHWQAKAPLVSLGTLTREVERLQRLFGLSGTLREVEDPDLAYGLQLLHDGKEILRYGQVKGDISEAYDLRHTVFYLRIDWQALEEIYFAQAPVFKEIPQYPAIRRDLSLLIPQSTQFQTIQALTAKANPKLIRSVALHDVYQGKGIPDDKKSYLISVEMRDDRKTLADATADKVIARVVQLLGQELGAELRQ